MTVPGNARLPLCHALLAALVCGPALAIPAVDLTTLPLEQLLTMEVYSASKFMQKASEAPSSVTVITNADIRNYGWRTLADVARSVRGLYVSYDRNYSYLGARGLLRRGDYNTRFLLLVDGNRINDGVYDQAPVGQEFPVELELIERIEFVPGPGSSIYGTNAFFGVINVITRKPSEQAGSHAMLEVGQAGWRKASASTQWRSEAGTAFMLSASAYGSAGRDLYFPEFDTPAQNHGIAKGLDDERGRRFLAKAAHGPFTLSLIHAMREKGIPTAAFSQPFNDGRSEIVDTQSFADLAWQGSLQAGLQASGRLYWGRVDSVGDYVNDDALRSLNHDGSSSRWWGMEGKLVSAAFSGQKLVAGFDYQDDYHMRQYTFDVDPYKFYLDNKQSRRRLGLYAQDELSLREDLLLSIGLRHDHSSNAGGVTSPRAALIYQHDRDTTFKAIYGSAFRAPNCYELYYSFPGAGGQLPNPALHKERIVTTELAVVRELGENARLTLSVFRNQGSGIITQEEIPPDDMARFDNTSRASARGIEIDFERRWPGDMQLHTTYSNMRVSLEPAVRVQNAPIHLLKFNASAPVPASQWRAGAEAQYTGPRNTVSGSVGGFWVANLNLWRKPLPHQVDVSVNVYNLFNRRYADPASTEHVMAAITQDGRSALVKVGYAF
jgi:outer membrane receptor protein involved in Fe transport